MTAVRVNGELLVRRSKPRPEHHEAVIDWLLNDAPGLLGEAGVSYGEGGGSHVVVDTDRFHARMQAAMWAVRKARRLTAVWRALDEETRSVLAARYAQRRWPQWYVAHFGELVGVVVYLNADQSAELSTAAGQSTKTSAKAALADALRGAAHASREAHRQWRERYREQAAEWADNT